MPWTHYRLVFRLESPLHIGWRKVGNLMQTRRYVPGKNLWAALTEGIVWRAGQGHDAEAYQHTGEALKQCFRFGYLWPARSSQDEHGHWALPTQPHFPWGATDLAYWDYLYLDGIARTALDPGHRTSAEGTLHEVEFIAPYTREGAPVHLVGDLWVRQDLPACLQTCCAAQLSDGLKQSILAWQTALQRLSIGGERGYGWGRVRLAACDVVPEPTWGTELSWQEVQGDVYLYATALANGPLHLPMHALAVDFHPDEKAVPHVLGPVEPWLGWERTRAGYRLSKVRILYEPGARYRADVGALWLHPWGMVYTKP